MDSEEKSLFEEMLRKYSNATKKASQPAKLTTLIIIFILAGIGVLGSFEFMKFDMSNYALFIEKFAILYVPLIVSIGGGTITGKVLEKKDKRAEGPMIAKGGK